MSSSDENEPPPNAGPEEPVKAGGSEEPAPEGVRVVGKRRKRKTDASRQTFYLKKKEILREMETEEDPLRVKAQLERLKKAARKGKKPLEEKWGNSSRRRRGSRWVIIAVCAIAIPLVVFLVVWSITKEEAGKTTGEGDPLIILDIEEDDIDAFDRTSPQAWFHENSVKAFDLAIGLLEKVNAARHPAQLSGTLRDFPRVSRDITVVEMDGWIDFSLGDPRTLSWEYGAVGETGYMVLMGRKADYSKFRAYFVKTDEGLKIDWEATNGESDIPVGSLVKEGSGKTPLIRGWVGKKPHYDVDKGRDDEAKALGSNRSWYVILDSTKEKFVFAYAPIGSKLDKALRDQLSYGRMVEKRPDEVRATVRLSKPSSGFQDNEFEIQEFITSDWVAP